MFLKDKILSVVKKKSLHQTAYVGFGSLVNGGSLLLLNIALARSITTESFGIFSLAVLALSTVGEMSDFGLNSGLLRFAPYYLATGQKEKFLQLIKTIWRWRLSLTIILTVGGLVLSYPLAKYIFSQPQISPYLTYSFLGIGGVVLLGFLTTFLQSNQKFVRQSVVQSLKGLLRIGLTVILIFAGVKNLYAYLSVYIFVPWLLFLMNYSVLPKNFNEVKIDEESKKLMHSQLAHFSFWLTVTSFMGIVTGKIDQVMVSHYLGLEEVAIYAVAWQLIQIFSVGSNSITAVLMPKISALKNKTELASFVWRSFKWTLTGAFVIAALIYPSQYLINFLFGQKYLAAMPIYLVLAYGMLMNVVNIPFSLTLLAFNKTNISPLIGIIQLIINIFGNILLVPHYGVMGSAYTFAFSAVVQMLWTAGWAVYLMKQKEFVIK